MDDQALANYPVLTWVDNEKEYKKIAVEDRVFIGRTCQAVPEDKRILVNEADVSRDHAAIRRMGVNLFIKDTSRNGTRVNDVRITAGSDYKLSEGDWIQIGSYQFRVEFPRAESIKRQAIEEESTRIMSVTETVTHLVADVRGFSTITQHSESKLVLDLVADIFQLLTDAVHQHHGTVKDFAGDAIYAFWEHGEQNSADKAYEACMTVKSQFATLNEHLSHRAADDPLKQVKLGWGIATGASTLSHYGVRSDNLALVGDSTNLAFRLAAMANNTLEHPVVICAKTAKLVENQLVLSDIGLVETKGREGKEQVFTYAL